MNLSRMHDRYLESIPSRDYMEDEFHVTDLVQCARKHWYKIKKGVERDSRTMRNFMIGNMLHEYMGKVFNNSDRVQGFKDEMSMELDKGDYKVLGRLDYLVTLKDISVPFVVEVKSIKNFHYIQDSPIENHRKQLNFYMSCLEALEGYEEVKGFIYYIRKMDGASRQFEVEHSVEDFREVIHSAHRLHECLEGGNIPDRQRSSLCSVCDYKEICDKDEERRN